MAQVQINLLTREFRPPGTSPVQRVVQWLAVLAVIAMAGVGVWQFVDLYSLTNDQAAAQIDLDRVKKQVADIQKVKLMQEQVSKEQNVIKNLEGSSQSTNVVLSGIQARTPAGVSLSSLSLKDGSIDIHLEAVSFVPVEKFVDSLKQEKNFSAVSIQSLGQDTGKPVQAQISVKYAKGGQGK